MRRLFTLGLLAALLAAGTVAPPAALAHATKPPKTLKLTWPSKKKCPHRYLVRLWSDGRAFGANRQILVRVFDVGILWQPNMKGVWMLRAFGEDKKGQRWHNNARKGGHHDTKKYRWAVFQACSKQKT